MVDPPLKRELVLVLPELVQDGQHADAAQTLYEVLEEDPQFIACVLDSLGSLVIEADMLEQVRGIVSGVNWRVRLGQRKKLVGKGVWV